MQPIHETSFQVRYYEVDFRGWLQPATILNYLQETAATHALKLGVSVADLRPRGLTWVLSRLHLKVERYPRRGANVRVRTWPSTREGLFSCREFELLDLQGDTLAIATSSWSVIDLATRRPVMINDHLPRYPLLPQRAVADDFKTLPRLERAEQELRFRVRRADLDINRHVNNVVYAAWGLETVPQEIAERCVPTKIEIGFRAEALYGDVILARSRRADHAGCFIHQLVNRNDGRELARLRTAWDEP